MLVLVEMVKEVKLRVRFLPEEQYHLGIAQIHSDILHQLSISENDAIAVKAVFQTAIRVIPSTVHSAKTSIFVDDDLLVNTGSNEGEDVFVRPLPPNRVKKAKNLLFQLLDDNVIDPLVLRQELVDRCISLFELVTTRSGVKLQLLDSVPKSPVCAIDEQTQIKIGIPEHIRLEVKDVVYYAKKIEQLEYELSMMKKCRKTHKVKGEFE